MLKMHSKTKRLKEVKGFEICDEFSNEDPCLETCKTT